MLEIIDPSIVGVAIAVAMFAGILVSLWVGRRIGLRSVARHGVAGIANVGSLETAVFALLGLMIAFTFSGALSRFDVRRTQAVDEANAIGTAWLRVALLPEAAQPPLRATFRSYVDSRIATYRLLPDIEAARLELSRSERLQNELWTQAAAAVRMPESRPGTEVLVMPALNQMFDIMTVRIVATRMHPPRIVYAMLFGLALASGLLGGYQTAGQTGHSRVHKVGFAAIVAFTLAVILDIEYPRLGWIRIDPIDQVIVDVRAGMD
jgi:hypothetical protein